MSDEMTLPVKSLQFGDGYEQLARHGMNDPEVFWNVTVIINSAADNNTLMAFLLDVGQDKPFQWQSPRNLSKRDYWIVGGISGTKRNGGGSEPIFFTRSMRFRGIVRPEDEIFCSTTYSLPSLIIAPSNTTYYFLP
jgi:phage-related protein